MNRRRLMKEGGVDGVLSGKFSINGNGDFVQFSKSNLQATTDDLGNTWNWHFAENQWDCILESGINEKINGNGTVSENGTLDLFRPSLTDNYYGIYIGYLTSGAFVDWGNTIGNGWRTLTGNEWHYILKERPGSYLNGESNARYATAVVNGVRGVILFPDEYSHPDGVTLPRSINPTDIYYSFEGNSYTVEDWLLMEEAGCVFLPSAGYASYDSQLALGEESYITVMFGNPYYWGRYYAAPNVNSSRCNVFDFSWGSTWIYGDGSIADGTYCSVRLVHPYEQEQIVVPDGYSLLTFKTFTLLLNPEGNYTHTSFTPNTDIQIIISNYNLDNTSYEILQEFKAGTSYPIRYNNNGYYILQQDVYKKLLIDNKYIMSTDPNEIQISVLFPNGEDGQEVIGTFENGTNCVTDNGSLSTNNSLQINGTDAIESTMESSAYSGEQFELYI